MFIKLINLELLHGSASFSPAFYREGLGSIPGLSVCFSSSSSFSAVIVPVILTHYFDPGATQPEYKNPLQKDKCVLHYEGKILLNDTGMVSLFLGEIETKRHTEKTVSFAGNAVHVVHH
jgi:hypothetical protein